MTAEAAPGNPIDFNNLDGELELFVRYPEGERRRIRASSPGGPVGQLVTGRVVSKNSDSGVLHVEPTEHFLVGAGGEKTAIGANATVVVIADHVTEIRRQPEQGTFPGM